MQGKQWLVDQLAERLDRPSGQRAADVLAYTRRHLGLTLAQMAKALGVTVGAVSQYEYRVFEPSHEFLVRVIQLVDRSKEG